MITTIFCFAGRRANMELQLPYIRKLLAEHSDVEYHIWNTARNDDDYQYLKTISGERIWVNNWFYSSKEPWKAFNRIYHHYTMPWFQDHLLVKIDDDIVFLETDSWTKFVAAIEANPDHIVSAKVINNGACTATEPGIWRRFEKLATTLPVSLRDVYKCPEYADMSHNFMFQHWRELLNQPVELIEPQSWLSINVIGYNWQMASRIFHLLNTKPQHGAFDSVGPEIPEGTTTQPVGDEGAVNILPRRICQGFLAAHLSYDPQHKTGTDCLEPPWRERYAEISHEYLAVKERSQ